MVRSFAVIVLLLIAVAIIAVAARARLRSRAVSRIEEKNGNVEFYSTSGIASFIQRHSGDWGRCWPAVHNVYLAGNQVADEDLEDIKKLEDVDALGISSSRISDRAMKFLAEMRSIRDLNLDAPIGDEGVRLLSRVKTIKALTLDDNTRISDEAGRAISSMSSLEELSVNNSSVGDAFIRHLQRLPRLRSLSLLSTDVTDKTLHDLEAIPSLEFVDLTYTLVSESSIEEFRRIRPTVRVSWSARPE